MQDKKYINAIPLFKVKCINDNKSCMLNKGSWYRVIDYDSSNYLIQFRSRGAKWYSRSRFRGKFVHESMYYTY